MKVKQLIEELQKMPDDALVLQYNSLHEEGDRVDKVKLLTQHEFPYCKSDPPEFEGSAVVLI